MTRDRALRKEQTQAADVRLGGHRILVSILLWLGKFTLRLIGVVLMWTVGVMAVGWIGVMTYQHWYDNRLKDWQIARIPASLHVSGMTYSNEISLGWGPGANESGFAVYDVPEGVASQISRQGLGFFGQPNVEGSWRVWQETPIALDGNWTNNILLDPNGTADPPNGFYSRNLMSLTGYVNEFGPGLENIPSDLEDRVNKAIHSPGGYYSYGGGGSLLILPPGARQAFLLYRG